MFSQKTLTREGCTQCKNLNTLTTWKIPNKINYLSKTMPKMNSFFSKNSFLKTYCWEVVEKYKATFCHIYQWWVSQVSAEICRSYVVSDKAKKSMVHGLKHSRQMMNLAKTILIESSKLKIIRGRSKERRIGHKRWSRLALTLWWRLIKLKTVHSQTKIHTIKRIITLMGMV